MYKIICKMYSMGEYIEIESSIEESIVFEDFEEAFVEVENLSILEPENKYEIKELTEEEQEKYARSIERLNK